MPRHVPTAARPVVDPGLLDSLRRCGALSRAQLERVVELLRVGAYPERPEDLVNCLVKDDLLTTYQARHLLHSKAPTLAVGDYVVLDRIGKGSMGAVYKARHRLMGREVALKLVAAHRASSPHAVARFRREMRLIGRLDHPNIVHALDAGQVGATLFIAMEYVPGRTLDQLMDTGGSLRPADAVHYAAQAADGLGHAHSRGVVHRDVKPSNLLLGEDGRIRVLDLGLATLAERGEEIASFATSDGIAVGTPEYIAPEQLATKDIDGRCDLYSLGCTIYHLICGRLPFPGESSLDRLAGRLVGRPTPIGEVKPGLPPRLIAVIETLMAHRPEDRYQSAAEAAEALRGLLKPRRAAPPGQGSSRATVLQTFGERPDPEPTAVIPRLKAPTQAPKKKGPVRWRVDTNAHLTQVAAIVAIPLAGWALWSQKAAVGPAGVIPPASAALAPLPSPSGDLWVTTGLGFFSQARWDEAIAELTRAAAAAPVDPWALYYKATAHYGAGQITSYRESCADLLRRFSGGGGAVGVERTLYACLFAEASVPDPTALVTLAERAAFWNRANTRVLAASFYRDGRYDEAHRLFQVSESHRGWDILFQAMTSYRIGRYDEARRLVEEADAWAERADRGDGWEWINASERLVEYPALRGEALRLVGR